MNIILIGGDSIMKKIIVFVGIIIFVIVISFMYLKQEKILSPLGNGKVSKEKKLVKL